MSISRIAAVALLAFAVAVPSGAQQQSKKKRVLAIGACKGFHHDAVSHALGTIWKLGLETGLWDTYIKTDTQLVTKQPLKSNAKNLNFFDAVFFYTSGELDMDDQQKADLMSFIKEDGKGFLGAHSANDTFYKWPEYGEMIGGYFDLHPWNRFNAPLIVEDREFPATRHLPPSLTLYDEIYQSKDFSRERVRVLIRLDETKIDLKQKGVHRTDGDFAVAWCRNYGKGRVLYNGLGHENAVWDDPGIQKMWIESVKWVLKLTDGDATPRPRPGK